MLHRNPEGWPRCDSAHGQMAAFSRPDVCRFWWPPVRQEHYCETVVETRLYTE
jgi:hypothetical protein